MVISSFRPCPLHDTDSHIVFLDTESLIAKLLVEHRLHNKRLKLQHKNRRHTVSPNPGRKMISNILQQVKHQLLEDTDDTSGGRTTPPSALSGKPHKNKRNQRIPSLLEVDSALDIAQVLVSCIHAWGMDSSIDALCKDRLGSFVPRQPVCFGLLSPGGNMCLHLPQVCTLLFLIHYVYIFYFKYCNVRITYVGRRVLVYF